MPRRGTFRRLALPAMPHRAAMFQERGAAAIAAGGLGWRVRKSFSNNQSNFIPQNTLRRGRASGNRTYGPPTEQAAVMLTIPQRRVGGGEVLLRRGCPFHTYPKRHARPVTSDSELSRTALGPEDWMPIEGRTRSPIDVANDLTGAPRAAQLVSTRRLGEPLCESR